MNNPSISVFKSFFIHKILVHPKKNGKKSEKSENFEEIQEFFWEDLKSVFWSEQLIVQNIAYLFRTSWPKNHNKTTNNLRCILCPSSLEIAEECKLLCQLRHDNLLQILGLTDGREPAADESRHAHPSLVLDYGPVCDLCQFLQDHVAETSPINGRILRSFTLFNLFKKLFFTLEKNRWI